MSHVLPEQLRIKIPVTDPLGSTINLTGRVLQTWFSSVYTSGPMFASSPIRRHLQLIPAFPPGGAVRERAFTYGMHFSFLLMALLLLCVSINTPAFSCYSSPSFSTSSTARRRAARDLGVCRIRQRRCVIEVECAGGIHRWTQRIWMKMGKHFFASFNSDRRDDGLFSGRPREGGGGGCSTG